MADISISWSWGSTKTIAFDPAVDRLDFNWFQAGQFEVEETSAGVRISIPSNNQAYVLANVSLAQLSPGRNIVALDGATAAKWNNLLDGASPVAETPEPPAEGETGTDDGGQTDTGQPGVDTGTPEPVAGPSQTTVINWRWGQTIAVDFNAARGDTLDFGWFQPGNFTISEVDGSVEIAISGNSQKYVLTGVSLSALSLNNIVAKDAAALEAWRVALGGAGETPVNEGDGDNGTGGDTGAGDDSGPHTDTGTGTGGETPDVPAPTDDGDTGAYAEAWSAGTVYFGGDKVALGNNVYVAGWWTQGNSPLASDNAVWKLIGHLDATPVVADAPDDVSANAIKATSAVVRWDAAEVDGFGTVTHYNIYADGQFLASTSDTYYKLSGLTAATHYEITVTAVDEAGESTHSEALFFSTLASDAADTASNQYFSPYIDMSLASSQDLVALAQASGIYDFTLAFVLSAGANTGEIHWGGYSSGSIADDTLWNGSTTILSNIQAIQNLGGEITISFGGANGVEAAVQFVADNGGAPMTDQDVAELAAVYESVITRYNVNRLDFDIEGAALPNTQANILRAKAIALLQDKYDDLEVSYTLPVMPDGLTADGVALLKVSDQHGVDIDVVNIMAMDYGTRHSDMGQAAIDATVNTLSQVRAAGLDAQIGVTPMIGVNDTTGNTGKEIFTLEDANQLLDFVDGNADIAYISMWSLGRDHPGNGLSPSHNGLSGVDNYEFAKVFAGL